MNIDLEKPIQFFVEPKKKGEIIEELANKLTDFEIQEVIKVINSKDFSLLSEEHIDAFRRGYPIEISGETFFNNENASMDTIIETLELAMNADPVDRHFMVIKLKDQLGKEHEYKNIDINKKHSEMDSLLEQRVNELIQKLKHPSVSEALRLLRSDRFKLLTDKHINLVSEYQSIDIDGEVFFDKAFSTGKEIAGIMRVAREVDKDSIISKLEEADDLFKNLAV